MRWSSPGSLSSTPERRVLGVALTVFAVLGGILAVIDARRHRLPHALVLPGLALALVLLTSAALAADEPSRLVGVWGGAASAFLVCLALHRARPTAFGGGDVTLAALAGAHLGWFGPDAVLSGILTGFLCGGAAAAGIVLSGARGAVFAFGPPLLLGTWWVLLAELR